VCDDHVSVRAGGVIEIDPALETQRLWDVDLYAMYEVAAPNRLEQTDREAKRQDVVRRLLSEEMVDSEDLTLPEGLVHLGVQPDRALQIVAERLLHNHPGPIH